MGGSRKPDPPLHPDDVDLSYTRLLFVGKPTIDDQYIHIDNIALNNRTFATATNPMRPSHGIAFRRYTDALNILESGGYDEEGLVKRPVIGPDAADPKAPASSLKPHVPRTKEEVEILAVRISMYFSAEDEAFMFATAKNLMLYHMHWANSGISEYVVKKALGIDTQHPAFAHYQHAINKNRDTFQARILEGAHVHAKRFIWASEKGKQILKWWKGERIDWITYNEKGKKCLFVIDPTYLIEEKFDTIAIAKEVFHEIMPAVDEDCLEKNGKPTKLGKIMIAKSLSLIQLEVTYIFAFWTDFDRMKYTKLLSTDHHCRDKETMLPYLMTIDAATSPVKVLKRNSPGRVVETLSVGYLFPMVPGRRYATTRRSGKRQRVGASNSKHTIKLTFDESDEDEDEEDDDDQDGVNTGKKRRRTRDGQSGDEDEGERV